MTGIEPDRYAPAIRDPREERSGSAPGRGSSIRRLPLRLALLVSLVVAAGACTGTQPAARTPEPPASAPETSAAQSTRSTEPGRVPGPSLPACAGDREPVALPEGFPEEFPFPPGTVITRARITEAGGSYVEGYAPLTLIEAARFYIDEIPAAGYVHGQGDSEAHEAESTFTGNGIQGHWLVASVDNCPDATALAVVTAELP